jgi:hypothetical protein
MEALKMLLIVAACAGIALAAILLFPGEKPVPGSINITDINTRENFTVNVTVNVTEGTTAFTTPICGYPGIGGQTERPKECQRRCSVLGTENYSFYLDPVIDPPGCNLFCVCTKTAG